MTDGSPLLLNEALTSSKGSSDTSSTQRLTMYLESRNHRITESVMLEKPSETIKALPRPPLALSPHATSTHNRHGGNATLNSLFFLEKPKVLSEKLPGSLLLINQ